MIEYLYRISLEFDWTYHGDKSPVYAVATSTEEVSLYVGRHLKSGAKIKSVSLLGERLAMNMFHGKPICARRR
jgi:hypothetical protein